VDAPQQEFADPPHVLPGVVAVGGAAAPVVAAAAAPAPHEAPTAPGGDARRLLRDLLAVNRETLAAMRAVLDATRQQAEIAKQQWELARQQLELARRAEQRVEEQRNSQREEFNRWLGEHGLLGGRSARAEKTIRTVLGQAMAEMVDYIDENDESLPESEFARRELADRYGSLLAHLWSIHGVLKHLSAAESANASGPAGEKPNS
jgi:hypothetical protein